MKEYRNIACVNGIIYIQKEDGTLEEIEMEDVAKKMQAVKVPEIKELKAMPCLDSVLRGE